MYIEVITDVDIADKYNYLQEENRIPLRIISLLVECEIWEAGAL